MGLLVLCVAPFVDETFSGVPMLGAPDIRSSFDLGYSGVAATILSVPLLLSLFVETPLLLFVKRFGRRRVVFAGFLGMALAAFAGALTTSAWQLAACLTASGIAAGLALSFTEASLMDAAPDHRELWMTRWTLAGSLGDLAGPGIIALFAWLSFGWRGAFVVVGAMSLIAALTVSRAISGGEIDDDDHLPIREALRRAFNNTSLLWWCVGVTLCDLLDEIVIVFAALFLREVRGADAATTALALSIFPAAAAVGLVVTERLLKRMQPLRILTVACVTCAAALVAFILVPNVGVAIVMLALVGFMNAPLFPLTTAQMYRALPEDSTTVNAVAHLFAPVQVLFPIAIAFTADRFGLSIAVAMLLLQPLGILLIRMTQRHGSAAARR
jgi:predicted MFS family arabinose efflux permease